MTRQSNNGCSYAMLVRNVFLDDMSTKLRIRIKFLSLDYIYDTKPKLIQ